MSTSHATGGLESIHSIEQQSNHAELPPIYALATTLNLESPFKNGQIIASFESKEDLKRYVKNDLSKAEKASIVISSSKNYAIYYCCEKSGHYRTTVRNNRKRNAFTKREKCDYKLVANFQDDKWILKMVQRSHNHPQVINKRKVRKLVTYAPLASEEMAPPKNEDNLPAMKTPNRDLLPNGPNPSNGDVYYNNNSANATPENANQFLTNNVFNNNNYQPEQMD